MSYTPNQYLIEGLSAQHVIYGRFLKKYKELPRYDIQEAPEGSKMDMEDKIDIVEHDTVDNIRTFYDVKSSKNSDKITYTHINGKGEKSKIYSGDFSIDLIFTFDTYTEGYIVKAKTFYDALISKINSGQEQVSKKYPEKGRYIWFTKDEIIALAIDNI